MIRCSDATLYTGVTTDPVRRLKEHQEDRKKGSKYARARIPLSVVYTEMHPNRSEAQKREAALKKHTKTEKEALVKSQKAEKTRAIKRV